MRKLVQIKTVTAINPIENADLIECAIVDNGWQTIIKKGEFAVDDKGVFFEIDSFLPLTDERFLFLEKNAITWEGERGIRLRTMKLRGTLSQGLLLPLSLFPEVENLDCDIAELLNVKKWERTLPAELHGLAKGNFPEFIPKTDQERVQNLVQEVFTDHKDDKYEITIKLDGSSFTGYLKDGEIGVCSRNWELKLEGNEGNAFIKAMFDTKLDVALKDLGLNIAVQAELMGLGIQGNRENLQRNQLFVFDIYLIDEQRYATPQERYGYVHRLHNFGFTGCHVPILAKYASLPRDNLSDLLRFADGESIGNKVREGLVYKSYYEQFSFKTISNQFLLKEK